MSDDIVNRIVQSLKSASLKQIPEQNLVPAITKIIRGAVQQNKPTNVISNSVASISVTLPGPIASAVVKKLPPKDLVPVITAIIKGAVGEDAAVAVIKTAPANAILKSISGNISSKIKNALRQRKLLPSSMNNFIPANLGNNEKPKFSGAKPRYVFTTGSKGTGYYRNTYVPRSTGPLGPPPPRNYSRMGLRELLDALKKFPGNSKNIMGLIRKIFDEEIYKLQRLRGSMRLRRAGNLLRTIPRNFSGRGNATSLVIDNVRNTRNMRELNNSRRNLGQVPNENIRRAFDEQRRRLAPRRPGGDRGGSGNAVAPGNWRRALIGKTSTPSGRPATNTGNWRKALAGAPIPEEQKRAINYAGGVPRAMNQIARVPEGPPEIARTAEALHLTNGNARQAMEVHNVSAPAINAVRQLGGPTRAVNVLEGLNTLSAPRKLPARRTRTKFLKPRIAELNRVINAVRKKKLVSLVAHNVTKTGNIHENENRLKKYYKKVLKANILRTPLAKIVRAAAKKRVM
jgi:hypothetical protein